MTFNNIISKYSELTKNNRASVNVYMKVFYTPDERKDIINFYNDIYIRHMKEYIISMKPGSQPLMAL